MSGFLCSMVGATYAAAGITYRSDAYASYLKLAVPFDSFNDTNDVAYLVAGSGLSSAASFTEGTNPALSSTQVKWTSSPNYVNSNFFTPGGAGLVYTLPTGIPTSVSGTFVIEGWFYATNSAGNNNWAISSADSGGRWLFGINNTSSFSFGDENNLGIGTGWRHIAIVCDAGTKRLYSDGIYQGAWISGNTGFTNLHLGQFNSGDSNDYNGYIQDLRVYVGTNKGYTGTNSGSANFTLPSSIISVIP